MKPQGPYISPWTTKQHWLISSVLHNCIIFAVVQNGQQAREGTIFPTLRDGKTFLRDNGFTLKQLQGA